MNGINVNCTKCGNLTMVSIDELRIFKKAICPCCDDRAARYIRHKIVYGFYDLPEINQAIAEAIVEKELMK